MRGAQPLRATLSIVQLRITFTGASPVMAGHPKQMLCVVQNFRARVRYAAQALAGTEIDSAALMSIACSVMPTSSQTYASLYADSM